MLCDVYSGAMDSEGTAQNTAYSMISLFRDIGVLLRPYTGRFVLATVLRAISDLVRLYPAYAFAQIITLLTAGTDIAMYPQILRLIGLMAAAYCFNICCRETAKFFGFQVSERVSLDAQLKTLAHFFRIDLRWHERTNSGNKLKRMQKGGQGLDQILRIWISNVIEVCVNFVGITIIIATFDRLIALILLGFIVVYYILSSVLLKRAVRMEEIVNIGEEDFSGLAFEAVNNIRSVKVLGMSEPLLSRLTKQAADLFGNIRLRIFWYRSRDVVLVIYSNGFYFSIVAFIVWGILHGDYSVGFLILFARYFDKLWENADEISRVTQDFLVAKYGVARMMTILREPVTIDLDKGKRDFPVDWRTIEFRGISFGYGSKTLVLKNVSLTIRRGERIGIVGVSGGGKSTLFKLLLKEHEHYTGDILIDGVPLRDIRRSSYFQYSAVVLQETEVFNFPLRDNITLANTDQRDNDPLLQRSIQIAHVTDFLAKLPKGLDTYIGEKGVKLSGGEKQRVGIARAVFKEPQLLLLDEATSHLDLESEEKIRDSLHQFFQTVTAIVIAHRLTTIREMDRIFVLENGEIIESGSFDELHNKKGRFYELWEKQKF